MAFSAKSFVLRASLSRQFSSTSMRCSQVGRTPISIPSEVDFNVLDVPQTAVQERASRKAPLPTIQIKGPLGEINMDVPVYVKIEHNKAARKATVSIADTSVRQQRAMWGTTRAYLQNHIVGVSEGHNTILRLVGVGYRATVESSATTVSPQYPGQQFVSLKVGYSHPIELGVPKGVKASTPQPTRILLEGIEKEVVKEFAAKIRKWRVPEPYKGKGIFVDDETIKLKAKKIK